jgi:hypothetical protein
MSMLWMVSPLVVAQTSTGNKSLGCVCLSASDINDVKVHRTAGKSMHG